MDTTKTRREAAFLVVVVFLLGVLVGGVATHVWGYRVWGHTGDARRPGLPSRNQVISDFTRELQLTPDQQKQLGTIIDQTRAKWTALYAPLQPEHEKIRQEGRNEIRAILTTEQQAKFDAFMQRLDEQRKRNEAQH